MKKYIFYLLMLMVSLSVHTAHYPDQVPYPYPVRPLQEVSFSHDRHLVPATTAYVPNPYEHSILGTPVTPENQHLFLPTAQPPANYGSNPTPTIVTGTEYLVPPSPVTTTYTTISVTTNSPRTPILGAQNSSDQCRRITMIFFGTFIPVLIGGITYYLTKLPIGHGK